MVSTLFDIYLYSVIFVRRIFVCKWRCHGFSPGIGMDSAGYLHYIPSFLYSRLWPFNASFDFDHVWRLRPRGQNFGLGLGLETRCPRPRFWPWSRNSLLLTELGEIKLLWTLTKQVIQGHRFWYQSKAHICDFLLVNNTNVGLYILAHAVLKLRGLLVKF